jgi:hypothetical protein
VALLAALLPKVTNEPSQNRHTSQPCVHLAQTQGTSAAPILAAGLAVMLTAR